MRKSILTQVVAVLLLAVAVASCRSGAVVRYPYPGQSSTSSAKSLPPGQAKKVYGHQSAKAFAPGQQKKNTPYPASQGNGNNQKKGKKKK